MALITIDRNPQPRLLRSFGVLLAIFVPLFGALVWWRTGRLQTAEGVWLVGGLLTAVYWLVPMLRRPIYVGWMYAAFPIGWTVSHLLMAIIYYVVITPIGWIIRATGRDPLNRTFDRAAPTYWTAHPPVEDVRRYFRQY